MVATTLTPVELREWDTLEVPGTLHASDRALIESLGRKRIAVDELRAGLRIESASWVGVIRLSQLEIHITPKLLGAPTWLVAMLDYTGGVETLRQLSGEYTIEQAGNNLLDLFTLLLCGQCQELWERGLLADYVERVEDLPVVRGRLLPDRQVRERFGRVDQLICRHDERETDIIENQLLAAALEVASRRARSVALRCRAHQLASLFFEQCDPQSLDLTVDDPISYHRLNEHYRPAHHLARVVLSGLGVRDLHARGSIDCFAFLLDMNALFEAFVDKLVRQLLLPSGARISSQQKDGTVLRDLMAGKRYANVIPDLVVSGASGVCVPIDAKYKMYEGEKADRGDLYQGFLYAMAFRASEQHQPRALLLYPTASESVSVRKIAINNKVLGNTAEIRLCSLPVARLLQEHRSTGPTLASLRAELLRTLELPPAW